MAQGWQKFLGGPMGKPVPSEAAASEAGVCQRAVDADV